VAETVPVAGGIERQAHRQLPAADTDVPLEAADLHARTSSTNRDKPILTAELFVPAQLSDLTTAAVASTAAGRGPYVRYGWRPGGDEDP
jgi:hypothetical protein